MPKAPELAINLWDLERLDPAMRRRLLAGRLGGQHVRVDPERRDEVAVPFACDLLTAAIACDLIRAQDREVGDRPARVYLRKGKAWVKLAAGALLTAEVEGKAVLDPDLFAAPCVEIRPAIERVRLGKGKSKGPVTGKRGDDEGVGESRIH